MLVEAREDLLAFAAFPQAHWKKIWSTNVVGGRNAGRDAPGLSDLRGVYELPSRLLVELR